MRNKRLGLSTGIAVALWTRERFGLNPRSSKQIDDKGSSICVAVLLASVTFIAAVPANSQPVTGESEHHLRITRPTEDSQTPQPGVQSGEQLQGGVTGFGGITNTDAWINPPAKSNSRDSASAV